MSVCVCVSMCICVSVCLCVCVCAFVCGCGGIIDIVLCGQLPQEVVVASTDPKDSGSVDEGDGKRIQAPRKIQTSSLHSSPSLKRLSSTTLMDLPSSDEEDIASRQPQGIENSEIGKDG